MAKEGDRVHPANMMCLAAPNRPFILPWRRQLAKRDHFTKKFKTTYDKEHWN